MLTFSCVSANHLGLISAMEKVIRHSIPIANCPKCFTFWMVLATTYLSGWNMIASLAISFLCAYLAIWLELLMGFIDLQFQKLYETLYPTTDITDSATTADHPSDTNSTLPHLSQGKDNTEANKD